MLYQPVLKDPFAREDLLSPTTVQYYRYPAARKASIERALTDAQECPPIQMNRKTK